ncbi:CoA-binding protein [Thermodesulfobacteriota bacterium]
MNKRIRNLHYLFHPESIAFIGATETPGKWGYEIFNRLKITGWKGRLYPVNPGRDSVLGFKAYPTVMDIPDDIDLAIFTIPAKPVLASVERCIEKKVKAGLVISAGFKETGGENIALEEELVELARPGDMIIVGPNCQGICTPSEQLFPMMPNFLPRKGTVAVVSQSGNVTN